jgi:hypothetical protein
MPTGTVLSLHRWPVKSFGGERLDVLPVDERGVPGDRAHALWQRGGKRLTARGAPGTLRWSARYDAPCDGAIPAPVVTAPDATTYRWDEPQLAERLSADLGRDVALVSDERGQQDVPRSILITVEASRRALESELGRPVDVLRFRPNLHVALDARPFAEQAWEGRRLRVGDAELELLHPCVRCSIITREPGTGASWGELLEHLTQRHDATFGIYARPLAPAAIRTGDPVELIA